MTSFREYGTFFIVPRRSVPHIEGVGVRNVWRITTCPDPTKRHWCDRHGYIASIQYGGVGSRDRAGRGTALARQIRIHCRTEDIAQRVASLIRAGSLLGYPDVMRFPDVAAVYPLAQLPRGLLLDEPFVRRFHEYTGAEYGCAAARAAWSDRSLVYALEKYRFSLERDSFTPHSADPIHRQVFPNRYKEETYHVTAAFAIIAAFSVIEEIGLEIRSSAQRPRFVGPRGRTWNPPVLADIEARLRSATIDPSETFPWIRRGAATQVEREMRPKFGTPASWNRRFGVRDRDMTIPEALHAASWLRNFVAAHKFKAMTSAISPYEVHNVQEIARRVLLSRLGLWRRFK